MSDFKGVNKLKLEKLFGMKTGYVLDFSNNSFQSFIVETIGVDIYDEKYDYGGASKANLLREFWSVESNYNVAKLNEALLEHWRTIQLTNDNDVSESKKQMYSECLRINEKLKTESDNEFIDTIQPNSDDIDFKILAEQIRDSIKKNQPEAALDRLHTFVIKFIRQICKNNNIEYNKTKPLHSFYGEYVKYLKTNDLIESEMTERILKSSISILEAFNKVRNDKSFAHDNKILNYNESMLIFKNISSIIEFLESVESKLNKQAKLDEINSDDLPF